MNSFAILKNESVDLKRGLREQIVAEELCRLHIIVMRVFECSLSKPIWLYNHKCCELRNEFCDNQCREVTVSMLEIYNEAIQAASPDCSGKDDIS